MMLNGIPKGTRYKDVLRPRGVRFARTAGASKLIRIEEARSRAKATMLRLRFFV